MIAARAWRAAGSYAASAGRSWDASVPFAPRIRRAWLAGWIERAVSLHASAANDLSLFHAKRPAHRDIWSSAELDLLAAGCRGTPRASFPMLAGILGRSHAATRRKASLCGFARSSS